MIRKLVLFIAVSGLFVSAVAAPVSASSAQTSISCDGETFEAPLSEAVDAYNQNVDKVPSIIRPYILSNTTEVQIRNATEENYTVKTNDTGHITSASIGAASGEDVIVVTDKETVCSVVNADKPATAFQEAYENGEIEIEGKGAYNSAKVFVAESVANTVNYLSKTVGDLF